MTYSKCNNCQGRAYFVKAETIVRCELCKGRGVCTVLDILNFEIG